MSMLNTNSSSTRSTSTTEPRHSVSHESLVKVFLCPRCEMPMKRLRSSADEEIFYFCSPCDSVRHPFDEDEEIEVAVTARERGFLERRQFALSF